MSGPGPVRDFSVGPFAESAAAWLASSSQIARSEPTPAATVLLLRDDPLEVFMIERSRSMKFAPSTWVFPGGRVDSGDAAMPMPTSAEQHIEHVASRLNAPLADVRAWLVAGVRELFEETGVLLASQSPEGELVLATGPEWAQRRSALEAHQTSFVEALGGLTPRVDLLEPVDRWVTPPFEQRRYDTAFLVAALPRGAQADVVTREAQGGRWCRPGEMLEAADRGDVQLLPPTRTRLISLLGDATADAVILRARAGGPLVTTRPWAVQGAAGPFLRAEVNP